MQTICKNPNLTGEDYEFAGIDHLQLAITLAPLIQFWMIQGVLPRPQKILHADDLKFTS
eukprot:c30891_g1_i1 orf=16-192(-)